MSFLNLVEVNCGEVFCDSNMVAKKFDTKHSHVTRNIRVLIKDIDTYLTGTKRSPKYKVEEREYRGRKYTVYLMNKKFFTLLAMRFRGEKPMRWQSLFIDAFEYMEERIVLADYNANNDTWTAQRKQGKIARKEETDVIKDFVDYATKQGSKNAKFYYKHITNSSYKALNLIQHKTPKLRDILNVYEVASLVLAEKIACDGLKKYMKLGRNYKDIYNSVRDDLLNFGGRLGIEQNWRQK